MPVYDPHIIKLLGRQGPINNGVWVNPSPAPPTPSLPPMTPNQNSSRRPTMPMSASYQSPNPHQNGFHPPHSPFPGSPAPRANGFLTPSHPPPPFMGQPYIGPSFAPPGSIPSTPQAMYPHPSSPHPGMFIQPPPHGLFGHDNLYIPTAVHRRISDGSSFAGPLTPGIPSSAPSPLPVQIGLGYPSSPAPLQANGQVMQAGSSDSMSAERRVSIEATVMKKKAAAASISGGAPSINEEDDEPPVNHGLGLGDVGVEQSSAGPTSASASSFDPTSSPELGGATSMSRTSSKSCPSSPDPTSLELNKAISDQHVDIIEAGGIAVADDTHVAPFTGSNSDPPLPAKSVFEQAPVPDEGNIKDSHAHSNGIAPNGTDESFVPYFPTLACSREENERYQQGHKVEST